MLFDRHYFLLILNALVIESEGNTKSLKLNSSPEFGINFWINYEKEINSKKLKFV